MYRPITNTLLLYYELFVQVTKTSFEPELTKLNQTFVPLPAAARLTVKPPAERRNPSEQKAEPSPTSLHSPASEEDLEEKVLVIDQDQKEV